MLCSTMPSHAPSILLDLDGTLIDSQPGILMSCRAALRALGHMSEPSLDFSTLIGPPIDEIMGVLLAPFGDDRVAEAVAAYRADYSQNGLYNCLPYPGIAQALAEFRQSGAQLYLATSKRRQFALRILENLNFASFFDGIYGSEDDGGLDHKPELIAHVIERHAIERSHCIMVGDRRYDVIGARANRIRALGVLWGYGTRGELESAGADDLIAEPLELPAAALSSLHPSSADYKESENVAATTQSGA
jgi:phosphoglycolate phosphatase